MYSIKTTLTDEEYKECRMWLKYSKDEFSFHFDKLSEEQQQRVHSILETYRLDILDTALEYKLKI